MYFGDRHLDTFDFIADAFLDDFVLIGVSVVAFHRRKHRPTSIGPPPWFSTILSGRAQCTVTFSLPDNVQHGEPDLKPQAELLVCGAVAFHRHELRMNSIR